MRCHRRRWPFTTWSSDRICIFPMEKTHTKIRPIIASHILLPLHSIYINYIPWNLLELVRDFDNAAMWEKKKPSKNQISVITYSYILKPLTFHKMVFLISFASPLEKVDSEFVVNKLQLHKPMSDACHLDWNQISSERVFSSQREKKMKFYNNSRCWFWNATLVKRKQIDANFSNW